MNGRVQRILLFGSLVLAVAPVTPAVAGGGCHSAGLESAKPVAKTTVDMEGMCFLPGVITVDPGTTVRFTNYDDLAHVVVGTGWGARTEVAPGEGVEQRFEEPGTYAYSCYLHPGMNGAVVVGQAAAAARTPVAPSPAAPGPAALAASSTAADGVDLGMLALGGLGGAVFGATASRRLHLRRSRA